MKKLLTLLLAATLIFCTACEWEAQTDETKKDTDTDVSTDVADTGKDEPDPYVAYSDYQGILARIKEAQSSPYSSVVTNGVDDSAVDMVEESEPSAAETNTGADYSTTNVQVEGIDEGDIVKTDGAYIYILRGDEVILLAAAGADTHELSRITVSGNTENTDDLTSSYATALTSKSYTKLSSLSSPNNTSANIKTTEMTTPVVLTTLPNVGQVTFLSSPVTSFVFLTAFVSTLCCVAFSLFFAIKTISL